MLLGSILEAPSGAVRRRYQPAHSSSPTRVGEINPAFRKRPVSPRRGSAGSLLDILTFQKSRIIIRPRTPTFGSAIRMHTQVVDSPSRARGRTPAPGLTEACGGVGCSLRVIVGRTAFYKHFLLQSRGKKPDILERNREFQGLTSGGSPQASSQPIENAQNRVEYLWKNAIAPLSPPSKNAKGRAFLWTRPLLRRRVA